MNKHILNLNKGYKERLPMDNYNKEQEGDIIGTETEFRQVFKTMKKAAWALKENGFKSSKEYLSLIADMAEARTMNDLQVSWEFFIRPENQPLRFCNMCDADGIKEVAEWRWKEKGQYFLCRRHMTETVEEMDLCKKEFQYLYRYTMQVYKDYKRTYKEDEKGNLVESLKWMRIPSRNKSKREQYDQITGKIDSVQGKMANSSSPDDRRNMKRQVGVLKSERGKLTQFVPQTLRVFIYVSFEDILLAAKDGKWNWWKEGTVKENFSKYDK